ncbi:MAG: beta-lactamase family protein [Clostridia bacterium]|nr:beta-lactamase family protein [Clostridia bacterium]
MKMKSRLLLTLIIPCLLIPVQGCSQQSNLPKKQTPTAVESKTAASSTAYWPGDSWRVSTPEEQGMDSGRLLEMLNFIKDGGNEIHSIVVIRNGYKVMDANFFPYKSDTKHVVFSCTKSITSTLFGIASGEGKIKSVDDKVLEYFSDKSIQKVDEKKKELTLKHLLTMTAGFDWSEYGAYDSNDSWIQMRNSKNAVQYILDKPMKEKPGSSFYYNTGASHLLSAVLQKATGKKTADYAEQKLFKPLGIRDVYWEEDVEGINIGGAGVYMSPLDMARLGYLYLRNGQWNGVQVIPENWVKEATNKHVETPAGLAGHDGYGYQWWMNKFGGYSARGFGGQYIFVLPEYDIVTVFTSSLQGSNFFLPEGLVESFIIPSAKSTESINGNTEAPRKLQRTVEVLQKAPEPKEIPALSQIAKDISGKLMKLENGEELVLSFNEGKNAEFRHGPTNNMLVGLDGVYRVSDAGKYWPLPDNNMIAAKGVWEDHKTFVLTVISLHEMDKLTYRFTFEGQAVNVEFLSQQGGEIMKSKGQVKAE